MPHIHSLKNLFPRLPGRAKILPSLIVLFDLNSTSLHQFINHIRMSMAQTNCVNHSNLMILVLCHLISTDTTNLLFPRTLKNTRNVILLAPVVVQVISHLAHRLVCTKHNLLINLIKLARMCTSELLTLRMNCRTNHNYLRIQPHEVIISQRHSPL